MTLPLAPAVSLLSPTVAGRVVPVAIVTADPNQPDLAIHLPRPDTAVIFWSLAVAAGMAALDRQSGVLRLVSGTLLGGVAGMAFGPLTYHFVTDPERDWHLRTNPYLALSCIILWASFGYYLFAGIRTAGNSFSLHPVRFVRWGWLIASKVFKGVPAPPPEDPPADDPNAPPTYTQGLPPREPKP